MTMQHALSADGLAVLSLTARSLGGQSSVTRDAVTPLGPREWSRVARALAAAGATPADLLGREIGDLATLLGGVPGAAETVARLAGRATIFALEVERLASRGIWLVSVAEDAYPTRLRDRLGDAAPPILYGAGTVELLGAGGIAIVGARNAHPEALTYAEEAAAAVARSGRPVVSGGARGIDQAAMAGAAQAGGSVVGVLADSLERQVRATEVRALIADERLVLLSPYGADLPFSVGNAMGRNRLIYCLADAAIVVSTAEGEGGTWAGATEALKTGWVPVHARTGAGAPAGNAALVARGALPLDDGPDEAGALPARSTRYADGPIREVASVRVAEQQTLFGASVEPITEAAAGSTTTRDHRKAGGSKRGS